MRQEERYGLLEHIKWIDEIAYDVPYCPSLETLEKVRADFVIHGDDIPYNSQGRCAYDEIIAANKLKIIKRTEGVSTTDIVGRLLLLTREHLDDPDAKAVAKMIQNPESTEASTNTSRSVKMLTTARRIAEFSSRRPVTDKDVVVYIDGAFDLFNVGHASTLKKARELGTYLIVGIYDDETVNSLKGKNYPIMNLHERVLNVCSCKWVDDVVIGAPPAVDEDLIKTLGIQIIAQGTHTSSKHSENIEAVQKFSSNGLVQYKEIESDWPYLTTAEIARRIGENRLKYLERNAKRGKMESDYYKQKQHTIEQSAAHGMFTQKLRLAAVKMKIQILSKPDCCLCDQAKFAVSRMVQNLPSNRYSVEVEKVDISTNAELMDEYGLSIPVVMVNDEVVMEGIVDIPKLRLFVQKRLETGSDTS